MSDLLSVKNALVGVTTAVISILSTFSIMFLTMPTPPPSLSRDEVKEIVRTESTDRTEVSAMIENNAPWVFEREAFRKETEALRQANKLNAAKIEAMELRLLEMEKLSTRIETKLDILIQQGKKERTE